jgi:hypothetical protein
MSDAIRKALKHRSIAADTVHKQRKDEVQAVQSNLIKEAKQRELEDTANRARTKSRHEEALDNLTDAIFKQMKSAPLPARHSPKKELFPSPAKTEVDDFFTPRKSTDRPINPKTMKPFGSKSRTYKDWLLGV